MGGNIKGCSEGLEITSPLLAQCRRNRREGIINLPPQSTDDGHAYRSDQCEEVLLAGVPLNSLRLPFRQEKGYCRLVDAHERLAAAVAEERDGPVEVVSDEREIMARGVDRPRVHLAEAVRRRPAHRVVDAAVVVDPHGRVVPPVRTS